MQTRIDPATMAWTQIKLKRADGLIFRPRRCFRRVEYHVEIPSRSAFFQIGQSEYVFLSFLDGQLTIEQALVRAARVLDTQAFSQQQAWVMSAWLLENGLVTATDDGHPLDNDFASNSGTESARGFNPFGIRIPLGSPDKLIEGLLPALGWLHSIPAAAAMGFFLLAAFLWHDNSGKDVLASGPIFWRQHWLWLGVGWMVAKALHEFSHALVCKRYGGRVGQMGLIFVLLAPLAYVDVSASWRFPSKWQRIHVAAAGIYSDLIVASSAMLGAYWAPDPIVARFCLEFALLLGIATLAFNANPLMRYDGYYILVDLLGIPNLYSLGTQRVQKLVKSVLVGRSSDAQPQRTRYEKLAITLYGIAAAAWRALVTAGLCLAAAAMFQGFGILVAIAGLYSSYRRPLTQFIEYVTELWSLQPLRLIRAGIVSLLLFGLSFAAIMTLPTPWATTAPAVVEFTESAIVRAGAPGFVRRIQVRDGDRVSQGDLLFELENVELLSDLNRLELALEQSQIRERIALSSGKIAESQVEQQQQTSLANRLTELARQTAALQIRAPVDGLAIVPPGDILQDTYVEEGRELCVVDDRDHKELQLSIAQLDVQAFAPGQHMTVRIGTHRCFTGTISRIEPRAQRQPQNPAFCAPRGGPIPAQPRDNSSEFDFVEPRFRAVIEIPQEISQFVYAGQRGYAHSSTRRSLRDGLSVAFRKWLRQKWRDGTPK